MNLYHGRNRAEDVLFSVAEKARIGRSGGEQKCSGLWINVVLFPQEPLDGSAAQFGTKSSTFGAVLSRSLSIDDCLFPH